MLYYYSFIGRFEYILRVVYFKLTGTKRSLSLSDCRLSVVCQAWSTVIWWPHVGPLDHKFKSKVNLINSLGPHFLSYLKYLFSRKSSKPGYVGLNTNAINQSNDNIITWSRGSIFNDSNKKLIEISAYLSQYIIYLSWPQFPHKYCLILCCYKVNTICVRLTSSCYCRLTCYQTKRKKKKNT